MARKRVVAYLTKDEDTYLAQLRKASASESDGEALRFSLKTLKMITEGQAFVFPAAPGIRTMVEGQYQLQAAGKKAKKGE